MLHIELNFILVMGVHRHAIVIYIGSAVVTQWPVQNYAPTIETICYNCNML